MEGSQSLDIESLIVRLALLAVECLCLQELFKGLGCLYLHQVKHLFPICLESEDEDPHNGQDPIIKAHAMRHCLVFWCNICYKIVH